MLWECPAYNHIRNTFMVARIHDFVGGGRGCGSDLRHAPDLKHAPDLRHAPDLTVRP